MVLIENIIMYFILYIRKIGEYVKKDLPELYKCQVSKDLNSKVYYSQGDISERNYKSLSVNELFSTYSYIFNLDVLIKTPKKDYKTRIAGRVGNNLITLDNDVIPINEVIEIIILK